MKRFLPVVPLVMITIASSAVPAKSEPPRVFTWIPGHVATARERALRGDAQLKPALDKLRAEADAIALGPLVAVTDKPADVVAPSGDPHDYTSVSVYFWPDPNDPKAAWISKDGQRNHEAINKFDGPRFSEMNKRVTTCAQAWYFTGEARYAEVAARQLRRWFIEPATRMNPNLNYAQSWPNKSAGTPWGIIDANGFPDLLNSIGLLETSPIWTNTDRDGMKQWFTEYLDWLLNSELGRKERAATNNHGTFYDTQTASAALFIGDEARAREILEKVGPERIASQIQPDGSTPHEQARPNASMYTCWNLKGLADLVVLGNKVGVDVWGYKSEDGRSLRQAAHWLLPYLEKPETWKFGVDPIKPTSATEFFWILYTVADDQELKAAFRRLMTPEPTTVGETPKWRESRWNLLYPMES